MNYNFWGAITLSILTFFVTSAASDAVVIAFEAESPTTLGTEFFEENTRTGFSGSGYLTSNSTTNNPTIKSADVSEYNLTGFAAAGIYDLYLKYGAIAGNSDNSFFYAPTFGDYFTNDSSN